MKPCYFLLLLAILLSFVHGKEAQESSPPPKMSSANEEILAAVRQLRNEGLSLKDKSKYKESVAKLQESITRLKDITLEKESDKITVGALHAQILYDYASVLMLLKEYKVASEVLEDTMDATSKIFGESHPTFGMALRSLAEVYMELGRYQDAILRYKKLKSQVLQALGAQHEVYVETSLRIGECYIKLGKYKNATKAFKSILKKLGAKVDEAAPGIADIYMGLSTALARRQQVDEALEYAHKAATAFKANKGKTSMEYAFSLNNLAGVYSVENRLDQSLKYLKEAREIAQKHFDHDHDILKAAAKHIRDVEARLAQSQEKIEL